MADFLFVGTLVGLAIGLFHARYLSRLAVRWSGSAAPGTAISVISLSLWTCGLWILMGVYVLGLWLIAVVFYGVFKAFR
jgi:hypothetical protein